jgi:hypothetical protein
VDRLLLVTLIAVPGIEVINNQLNLLIDVVHIRVFLIINYNWCDLLLHSQLLLIDYWFSIILHLETN